MSTLHRHGAEAARRTHNPEVTGSNPVPGILQFGCFIEATRLASDVKCSQNTLYRDGAGVARGAHNPEATGSNPVPGILHFARFIETRGHSSSDLKHEHQYCRCSSAEERLNTRPYSL